MQRPLRRTRKFSYLRVRELAASSILTLITSGCHSANINATIHNQTATAISLVQVDYPTASFGVQSLAPGKEFKYRFKVLGSGLVKITYTDSGHMEHKSDGPSLNEREEGTLDIDVAADGTHWGFHRTPESDSAQ